VNFEGRPPLEFDCPHCKKRGHHPVVRTLRPFYHWDDVTVPTWKELLGHDLSYRVREKKCVSCSRQFETVEIAHEDFRLLVRELLDLLKKAAALEDAKEEARVAIKEAAKTLNRMAKTLSLI
jgi:hypothetical protein